VYGKLVPEEATRACAQAVLGSVLVGGSGVTKKLVLLVGPKGNNGKTAFMVLCRETLGDYYGTLAIQVLTEKKDTADGCNPSLCGARKRRLCVLNEGQQGAQLQPDVVKRLTGGDDMTYRNLYGQPEAGPFLPKLFLVSNHTPRVRDESDAAFLHRFYGVDFQSSFEKDLDRDEPAAKRFRALSESEVKKQYKVWAAIHMLLLLRYARRFLQQGSLPPVPSDSHAAHSLQAGTVESEVRAWLSENYEETDERDFKDRSVSAEAKKTRTCVNLEHLWESWCEHARDLRGRGAAEFFKPDFEAVLTKAGVVVKYIHNQHVNYKKAVFLRNKLVEAAVEAE
jgi:hypothetical protein